MIRCHDAFDMEGTMTLSSLAGLDWNEVVISDVSSLTFHLSCFTSHDNPQGCQEADQ